MEKKQLVLAKVSVFISIVALFSACNSDHSARLKVKVSDFSNKNVIIEEQRVNGEKVLDSLTFSSKGRLSYKFSLKEPKFYNLRIEGNKSVFLLLKPKEVVEISGNTQKIVVEGSEESKRLNYLYDSLSTVISELNQIRKKYRLSINDTDRERLENKYTEIINNHHKFSIKYVLEGLSSLSSLAALYQEVSPNEYVFNKGTDLQFFKLLSDSLIKYYPKNRHVLALKRNFNSMHDRIQVDRLMSSAKVIETNVPEITLPNEKSQPTKLSRMPQRFVLLNFWSPQIAESRMMFPELNSIYNLNKNKNFNIYNVCLSKSEEAWKKSIAFEEIGKWTNVIDTAFPKSKILGMYNIQVLPTNFLIDTKKSIILERDLSPTELNRKLALLLDN